MSCFGRSGWGICNPMPSCILRSFVLCPIPPKDWPLSGDERWCRSTATGVKTSRKEVRAKLPSDYGRSNGIAWYYLGGFGIVHGKTVDPTNEVIVKWASAD